MGDAHRMEGVLLGQAVVICVREGDPVLLQELRKRSEGKEDGGVCCRSWPLLVMEAGARHLHLALKELPFSLGGHTQPE